MTAPEREINMDRIFNLMQQYREVDDRARQREIENEVLAATVWQDNQRTKGSGLSLSQDDWGLIYTELPAEATEAKRLVRSLWVKSNG